MLLHEQPGPPVPQLLQPPEQSDQRAIVIGTHGMERRMLDDIIGVDANKARPVELGKIRLMPRRQQKYSVNAARLQDDIETLHRDTMLPDEKNLEIEAQFLGAPPR